MSHSTSERKSNLELLRILAMIGVIVLHYNSSGNIGAFHTVEKGSINCYLLYTLEAMAISSVNLFVLISGYFMCTSMKRNTIKPFKLLVQVILFREASVLFSYVLGVMSSGEFVFFELMKGILRGLIPNNYYVILYVALYLITIYINSVLISLDQSKFKQMIIILILLFSVWATGVDMLSSITGEAFIGLSTIGIDGSQNGYTIVNFVMMYCIGAYLRKISERKYSLKILLLCYVITISLVVIWSMTDILFGWKIAHIAWEYCNPLVVLLAILLFLIFKQLEMRYSRIINGIAKGSFTVFLAHSMFIPYIGVEKYCNSNTGILLVHIVISCIVIYGICWIMYIIYEAITAPIFKWLEKKIHFPVIDLSRQDN